MYLSKVRFFHQLKVNDHPLQTSTASPTIQSLAILAASTATNGLDVLFQFVIDRTDVPSHGAYPFETDVHMEDEDDDALLVSKATDHRAMVVGWSAVDDDDGGGDEWDAMVLADKAE